MKAIVIYKLPIGLYVVQGAGPEDSCTCSGVGVLLKVASALQKEADSVAVAEVDERWKNKEKVA